jgi:predicted enzyme related to lactoylglutathione lyase
MLKDIEAAYARRLAPGAAALEPVTEVGGGIRVAAVRDPFGNPLGLIHNPHFDPAEVR